MVLTAHKGALALVAIAAVAVGVLLFSITSLASPEAGGIPPTFVDVNVADGDDPAGHAGEIQMPGQLALIIDFDETLNFITISGEPPWVDVSGAIENGQIFASGSGKVAGFQGIAVNFQGKLEPTRQLSGQYRMGTAGGLPGGQPITYTLKPSDPPALTPTATPTPTEPGLAAPTDTPPPPPALTPTATPTPTDFGLAAPTDTPVLGFAAVQKLDADTGFALVGWEMRVFAGDGCAGSPILSELTTEDGFFIGLEVDLPPGDYSVAETQQAGWERAAGTAFCQNFTPNGDFIVFANRRIRNGDVNGDGVTNSIDVAIVFQTIAGLISAPRADYVRGDVNGDGEINAVDAQLMLQFGAGLLDSLPVGQ